MASITSWNRLEPRTRSASLPGVQAIVSRLRAMGVLEPEQLVDSCLDLLGPVEVGVDTKKELTEAAKQWGEITWDGAGAQNASRRAAEMLQLIAATREYQFG